MQDCKECKCLLTTQRPYSLGKINAVPPAASPARELLPLAFVAEQVHTGSDPATAFARVSDDIRKVSIRATGLMHTVSGH